MGNKRWTRVLALCMAVVCTLTVVAATEFGALDFNKDGKVTVWDLQKWLGQDNYAAALKQVLGGKGDELNPVRYEGEGENAVPVYEIWSELGLRNMAKKANKGYTFRLMNSIDLGGKEWTPIKYFHGKFIAAEDNLTISNFTITKSGDGTNMGFFGNIRNYELVEGTTIRSEVSGLHLKNVKIIVDGVDDDKNDNEAVRNVGAIAGTNSGDLKNCSAEVIVYDKRNLAELNKRTYYGTLVGLNAVGEGKSTGKISGTNDLPTTVNITEESKKTRENAVPFKDPGTKVNSKMALFLSDRVDYATRTARTKVGIAGYTHGDGIVDEDLRWQDITNSTDLADEALQQRREATAAEMYKLCTEEWQPAERMYAYNDYNAGKWNAQTTILASETDSLGIYTTKVPQIGLPYAQSVTSLGRFEAYVKHYDGTDGVTQWSPESYFFNNSAGVEATNALWVEYKAVANEKSESYDANAAKQLLNNNPVLKAILLMYNVTSATNTPVGVRPSNGEERPYDQLGWGLYIGSDCVGQVSSAWRKVSACKSALNDETKQYFTEGFAKVMGTAEIFPNETNINQYGIQPVNDLKFEDPSENSSAGRYGVIESYYKSNKTHYLDALAMTSKGDILMGYSKGSGHALMAISDAVAIRKWDGSVDLSLSYIVTAEQGGSGTDSDGTNHYYEKMTGLDRFKWKSTCCVDRRTTFADLAKDKDYAGAGEAPWMFFPVTCDVLRDADSASSTVNVCMSADGKVTSNFHIVSTTVNGETKYTALRQDVGGYRGPGNEIKLTEVHGAIADETPVTVNLSDGQTRTLYMRKEQKITYNVNDYLPAVN